MSPARLAGRELNQRIRECLLAILNDTWPMPWGTPQLQRAFGGRGFYSKTYPGLMNLASKQLVRAFPDQRWVWWVACGDPLGPPRCTICERPATGIAQLEFRHGLGGWSCDEKSHRLRVATEVEWPWPSGKELELTLARPEWWALKET